jgi:hypothetical protein
VFRKQMEPTGGPWNCHRFYLRLSLRCAPTRKVVENDIAGTPPIPPPAIKHPLACQWYRTGPFIQVFAEHPIEANIRRPAAGFGTIWLQGVFSVHPTKAYLA